MIFPIVFLILQLPLYYGMSLLFPKAGRKAWEAWVPIYNFYVVAKISGKPVWWALLLLFPGVNVIMFYVFIVNIFKSFGVRDRNSHIKGCVLFFIEIPKLGRTATTKYVPLDQRPPVIKSMAREWGEAIIFAVVAATIIKTYTFEPYQIPTSSMEQDLLIGDFLFVSKLNYGPRVPMTPLSFPLVHNTLPFTATKTSYLEWWKIPYLRIPGFQKVKNNDVIVFNFPPNDTTINDPELRAHNYYERVMQRATEIMYSTNRAPDWGNWEKYMNTARQDIHKKYDIITHPIDKRENYIKRCVGIAGDVIEVKDGILYVNNQLAQRPSEVQYSYNVRFKPGMTPSMKELKNSGFTQEDNRASDAGFSGNWVLTDAQYEMLLKNDAIDTIYRIIYPKSNQVIQTFPFDPQYDWSVDNFGPLTIPAKGATVTLNKQTLPLYRQLITSYEGHQLAVKGDQILIDGVVATSYTFEQDYYFAMGDNRHNSADSRIFGFIPHDHLVGKAIFTFLSFDKEKKFPANIRWDRVFKGID